MIRHICMFRIKEGDRDRRLAKFIECTEMLREINEIVSFSVVTNSPDAPQSNYDVSLIFDFEDNDALEAYSISDIHIAFKDAIADLKTDRACIDYEF